MDEKELFDLPLNASPDLTKRIAFGATGVADENMTFNQLFALVLDNSDTYSKKQVDEFFLNYLIRDTLK